MKKWIIMLIAVVLGAGSAQAGLVANIYGHAVTPDGDWDKASNWWTGVVPGADSKVYLRGDNLPDGSHTLDIGAGAATSFLTYSAERNGNTAYDIISSSGGSLTIDATIENQIGNMIEVRDAVLADQTISTDLVLASNSSPDDEHIRTRNSTARLILASDISQTAASQGIGIVLGNGDVEIAGGLDGSGKQWQIWRPDEGIGIFEITGSASDSGLMIINLNAEVFLNNPAANSTTLGMAHCWIRGGQLVLGNNDQIKDSLIPQFDAGSGSVVELDGFTDTIAGFQFGAASHTGMLDMGDGGVLHLADQSSSALWGTLTVTNWDSDVDHIYVDGGSFSSAQLAAISFSDWEPVGAKVEGGELLPTGSFAGASAYETWAAGFGVGAGSEDVDNDGLSNIYEYGLGGDPTNATDRGLSPVFSVDAGALIYVYPQLSAPDNGLDYHLELTDNLIVDSWGDAGYTVTGTNSVVGDFNYVTNEVSTVSKTTQFIKLIINEL